MNAKYPDLLSPGKIGNVELRNKTVMAAMGMSQAENGFVNKAVLNHYAERAKGGVGAIIVEVTCVDSPLGLNTKGMLVIDDDKYIPGMAQLADVIHEGGSKAFLQISHTGRGARRKIIGAQPVGPSAVAMPYSYMMGLANETPRALTIDEIKTIEEKYAQAALRAKKAGFDGASASPEAQMPLTSTERRPKSPGALAEFRLCQCPSETSEATGQNRSPI